MQVELFYSVNRINIDFIDVCEARNFMQYRSPNATLDRPGVNPPSTIPIPVDFLFPNPIQVNLAMIPIPVIFPSATSSPTPIPISSYWYEIIVRELPN